MEVRRFGPGHRRPDGPPGTQGVSGQVIHDDAGVLVSELAFQRYAMITPHSNPNKTLFVVISGGGHVQVGDERARINHGEAVVWPAGVPHGVYTDGSEMRAIVVELVGDGQRARILEGRAAEIAAGGSGGRDAPVDRHLDSVEREAPAVSRAEGSLAERDPRRDEYDASEGEPW
jgi:quercetin dioxygenase-like cupin family protein